MARSFIGWFSIFQAISLARGCRIAAAFALAFAWQASAPCDARQVASELAATHGYVYVYFPKQVGLLEIRPVSGGSTSKLIQRNDQDGKAYGLWLPPGNYRISNWNSYDWGDYPEFKVEAGRVTDLGGLVPFDMGGYQQVVLPVRAEEDAHRIDMVLHEYASLLKSSDPIVWNPSAPPKPIQLTQGPGAGTLIGSLVAHGREVNKTAPITRIEEAASKEEFLSLIRSISRPLYRQSARDPEGNFYFGADLGQICIRHGDGTWSHIGMDTLHSISGVAVEDGVIYAGSDNGVLRSSDDHGVTWHDAHRFSDDESIIDIEHEGVTWIVTTAHQLPSAAGGVTTDQLTVYVSQDASFDSLKSSMEFSIGKGLLGWVGAMGQLVHGSYFINNHSGLFRYDLAARQWKNITPLLGTFISMHHVDPDTGEVSVLLGKESLSKLFVSDDTGNSWKEIKLPPKNVADVQFDGPGRGYSLRANPGTFTVSWEIYSYNERSDSWTLESTSPLNCVPMRVSALIPTLCLSNNASILSQRGKEWSVEFSAQ